MNSDGNHVDKDAAALGMMMVSVIVGAAWFCFGIAVGYAIWH